ncbi:MAG: phenylacetate--CoA ligase family protein, partial [Proteobacteria bacterium]|nr:phenylacetate--CoA ligase family protein [Pseudomonadota bacterium]
MVDHNFWNKEVECASLAATKKLHDDKLKKQLAYVCASSKFYQQKFAAHGVDALKISGTEDLQMLPFTEKSELRESQSRIPPFGEHVACNTEDVRRVYSTSGTTGRPTYIGLTKADIATWRETASRVFWANGLRTS